MNSRLRIAGVEAVRRIRELDLVTDEEQDERFGHLVRSTALLKVLSFNQLLRARIFCGRRPVVRGERRFHP